jgi:hypothetical protein
MAARQHVAVCVGSGSCEPRDSVVVLLNVVEVLMDHVYAGGCTVPRIGSKLEFYFWLSGAYYV